MTPGRPPHDSAGGESGGDSGFRGIRRTRRGEPERRSDRQQDGLSRRRFLRGVAGVGASAAVAGCGAITTYEFSTEPVVLPERSRTRMGYEETLREPVVAERSREVAGVEVEATVESHVAIYETVTGSESGRTPQADDGDGPTASTPSVGVASTPRATVSGRSFNPLARLSLANLVTSDAGNAFRRRVGLDRVGVPRERVRWERGPEFVAEREATCVGARVTIESYAGILGGESPTVAVVHLVRADAESVVLPAAVHGRTVADVRGSLVGPDGLLSHDAFDAAVETFVTACEAFQYER